LKDVLQHRFVERQVCHQALELDVLLAQLLQELIRELDGQQSPRRAAAAA